MSGTYTVRELAREAERELAMRTRNYPYWVNRGTLKPQQAERQMLLMEAIAAKLRTEAEAEEAQGSLL